MTGCAAPTRECMPKELAESRLRDVSMPPEAFPIYDPDPLSACKELIQKEQSDKPLPNRRAQNYLALSGGGAYGAFTVGVLNGWTESGKRPEFDVVTGISTGAMIATYAFLGPKYDAMVRDYYANNTSSDLFRMRRPLSLLWADSLATTEPLQKTLEAAITPELLHEVAEAHLKGRRLYIGTTNLDTRKLVIWDMGAIASSGQPDAAKIYRDVILASSAVPGFLPPVYIDVEVNGQSYREMHVDGGATSAVFFQPFMLNLEKSNIRSRAGSNRGS